MKPFDYNAAKRGEPICNRLGERVYFVRDIDNPIPKFEVTFSKEGDDPSLIREHWHNGQRADGSDFRFDLYMADEE